MGIFSRHSHIGSPIHLYGLPVFLWSEGGTNDPKDRVNNSMPKLASASFICFFVLKKSSEASTQTKIPAPFEPKRPQIMFPITTSTNLTRRSSSTSMQTSRLLSKTRPQAICSALKLPESILANSSCALSLGGLSQYWVQSLGPVTLPFESTLKGMADKRASHIF